MSQLVESIIITDRTWLLHFLLGLWLNMLLFLPRRWVFSIDWHIFTEIFDSWGIEYMFIFMMFFKISDYIAIFPLQFGYFTILM